jgi:DNA polymerase-3 subunit alpha
VHACGIIIGKDDLENYIPISTAKDSELTYVTQYDGKHVEDIGLLKMDFLGLKTLTIIKHAVQNIKLSKGIDLDIDHVDLTDKKTYKLYSKGDTTGLFQFESPGMKKYLKDLKPTKFEDLIAMNALFRPGPMDYIPSFIKRKNGIEEIKYDLPMMKEFLEETYGITVYQEQVMLLARKLAGFSRGQSDTLRKAMGKKIIAMMDELKIKFEEGCKANEQFIEECKQTNKNIIELIRKIWGDWEAFAKYAFNKSHATCYSYISFQTAYLKAHYPAEFMAAVLSNNMNDIEKVTFFIDECRNQGIKVLGPDINESQNNFAVNNEGHIRFGLNAIKGVGEAAVNEIIRERTENGNYKGIFGLVKRVNLRTVNKKCLESMALAGTFDSFKATPRHVFFHKETENSSTFIEKIIQFGHKYQDEQNSSQVSLFGDLGLVELPDPEIPFAEAWSHLETLQKENEVVGFYLSGHPLDQYNIEIKEFTNSTLKKLEKALSDLNSNNVNFNDNNSAMSSDQKYLKKLIEKTYTIAGIIANPASTSMVTKTGKPYGRFVVEDYTGSIEISMFGDKFEKFKNLLSRKDQYVLLRSKLEKPSWKENGTYEIKVIGVELLSEILENKSKQLDINLNLHDISSQLVDNLNDIITTNSGKTPLYFNIRNKENEIIRLSLQNKKVNARNFIIEGTKNTDIHIKIVK